MRKKIFALLVLGIVFAANVCFAQDVRVSDYGVDGLVAKYNEFAPPEVKITSPPQFDGRANIAGYLYESYKAEISNGDALCWIIFLATPDGYVSKVMIIGSFSSGSPAICSAKMLLALGLNDEEYRNLVNSFDNNLNGYVWCSAKQRYIRHSLTSTITDGVGGIILSAFKN